MLLHDPIVLRDDVHDDGLRLQLLRHDEQHAGLLLLSVLRILSETLFPTSSRAQSLNGSTESRASPLPDLKWPFDSDKSRTERPFLVYGERDKRRTSRLFDHRSGLLISRLVNCLLPGKWNQDSWADRESRRRKNGMLTAVYLIHRMKPAVDSIDAHFSVPRCWSNLQITCRTNHH
jgi:hypothetical protein